MSRRRRATAALLVAAAVAPGSLVQVAAACPADAVPRAPEVLLVVQGAGPARLALDGTALAALPAATLVQRIAVSGEGSGSTERSISYGGTRLRDLLPRAGLGGADDRAARFATVEAVASDGYRALFSWGELFNSPAGDQVLVISTQDGRPLDAAAGPLALPRPVRPAARPAPCAQPVRGGGAALRGAAPGYAPGRCAAGKV